uniref:Reverse transcriptase domain-containing protein n=1 Tax=Mola mola TaxID=94237 RepID=A0A3Q3WP19_MOLML
MTNPVSVGVSAAFDTIDHQILIQRLYDLIYIRYQFVHVNHQSSMYTTVNYGIPQGPVLGPILLILYILILGNIIRNHTMNFHCYADDIQLYLSLKPDEANRLTKFHASIKDIKTWMTCNCLMLNSTKTEVIMLGPEHLNILTAVNWQLKAAL